MFIIKKIPKSSIKKIEKYRLKKGALKGSVIVPGDKSISQRAIIIGLISIGTTVIEDILDSEDVYHTLKAVESLGASVNIKNNKVIIKGIGLGNLISPKKPINMGNSGTGARLLIGLVAGSNAIVTFYGDKSLSTRPMERIIKPLEKMGAQFISSNGQNLPITVVGARFKGITLPITHKTLVASAQVKSAILLAALTSRGVTTVKEPFKSRNNTESMLLERGVEINSKTIKSGANIVKIKGASYLKSSDISVPGDPSSAVFLVVAALITKNSNIVIKDIMNDNMRLRALKVLIKMGGNISFIKKTKKKLDIRVKYSSLSNISIPSKDSTALIDEFPILSIAAACGNGKMSMKGLGELRYKESNRFLAIELGLKRCGINIKAIKDNLEIIGQKNVIGGCEIDSKNDHRIAMAFNILNLVSEKPIKIIGNNSIVTSFPSFFDTFKKLGISIKPYD
jgi:3-phosphoshikimate 1-carboxyvinyltransferase